MPRRATGCPHVAPQRRNRNRVDVEPVVEIFPEGPI
jgi:hypothetical protein